MLVCQISRFWCGVLKIYNIHMHSHEYTHSVKEYMVLFTLCWHFHLEHFSRPSSSILEMEGRQAKKSNKITSNYLRLYKNPKQNTSNTRRPHKQATHIDTLAPRAFEEKCAHPGRHFCLTPQSTRRKGQGLKAAAAAAAGRSPELYKSKVNNNYNNDNM